jgi:hypothetical protein
MAEKDFDRLFPNGIRFQTRKAGLALFHQGQPFDQVLIIRSGWVLTYKVFQDGQRQIIRFALPGDLIGFEGDENSGMAYTAEALSDVTLCSFKRSLFYGVCANSPQLAMNFATTVTARPWPPGTTSERWGSNRPWGGSRTSCSTCIDGRRPGAERKVLRSGSRSIRSTSPTPRGLRRSMSAAP